MALSELLFENARILFRNFAGNEQKYNKKGDRNFCLLLSPEAAYDMAQDGWNVKTLKARDPEDPDQPYVQVAVNLENKFYPTTIVLISSRGRTTLPAELAVMIDLADIKNVDLIIRPRKWEWNGKEGVKAFLKSIYVTINEDLLELKYAHIPEIGSQEQMAIGAEPHQSWDYEGVIVEEEEQRAIGR